MAAIQLLGQCAVGGMSQDGAPLRIERQEQALLTYLLLHEKAPVHRERLIETLWPERPPENGCRCLSTAIWRLHKTMTPEAGIRIETSRAGWLRLRIEDSVTVDLWEFRRCSAEALHAQPTLGMRAVGLCARLERAVELYHGALCPHLDHSWLVEERLALEEQYLDCLAVLAGIHDEVGDHNRALVGYRQMLAVNRAREDAHTRMMEIYWKLGWRERAIRQYEQCAAALLADLDVTPMPETEALFRTILDGSRRSECKAQARWDARVDRPALLARIVAIQARMEHAQTDLVQLLQFVHTCDEPPLLPFMSGPDADERGLDC